MIIIAVVGAALGAAAALSREDSYTASASLSFRDISQDLSLFGVEALPQDPASVRAAVNAERVTRPQVTRRAARRFADELSPEQLAAAVQTRVGTQTQLVVIEATADNAELAARIANAYAAAATKLGAEEIDERLKKVEQSIFDELKGLGVEDVEKRPGVGTRIAILEQQLSRVQTLRDISEPVQIAQSAQPPSSPDDPSALSAGLVGGLIGLVLGLIGAFTRDALDRRVRSSHDVYAELGFPVIGRVPEGAMGYPGLADPRGRKPLTEADFEAFRVMRTNLGHLERDGDGSAQVVLITGSRSEEGKTTVSMSLAGASLLAGSRVLLIEGDLRRPSFAGRLGIEAAPGLSDYLRGTAEPREVVQVVDLYPPLGIDGRGGPSAPPVARLACIAAGTLGGDAAELLASRRFSHFISEVRGAYDVVIVDSSPLLAVVDPLELVEQADAVLLCARAHRTTRDELRAARSALGNLPERPYGAVITGLRRDGPDAYPYYYGY